MTGTGFTAWWKESRTTLSFIAASILLGDLAFLAFVLSSRYGS